MSELAIDNTTGAFVDQKCVIEHNGQHFESGGAWLCQRKDNGRFEGMVYGSWNESRVSNWDGSLSMPAHFGSVYRGNFGDKRRHVWFTYQGKRFHGVWCAIDWGQLIRVKQVSS